MVVLRGGAFSYERGTPVFFANLRPTQVPKPDEAPVVFASKAQALNAAAGPPPPRPSEKGTTYKVFRTFT